MPPRKVASHNYSGDQMRELGIEIVLYESVTSELQKRNSASLKWGPWVAKNEW